MAWRGQLLCGFERSTGEAVDLGDAALIPAFVACHPKLGLAEFSRWLNALAQQFPNEHLEWREALAAAFGLRWNVRLSQALQLVLKTPRTFQNWIDDKDLGARDLSPLLALPTLEDFSDFLTAMVQLPFSKSEGVRVLELGVELFLMDRPLNDLLPSSEDTRSYLKQLEKWRRPKTSGADEVWQKSVAEWPWPAQVQGQWQRSGDQSGLEIKIRTHSPQDLHKKLERLQEIQASWSCKI